MLKTITLAAVAALAISGAAMAQDRTGSFKGASNHITEGTVSVAESGSGATLRLGRDFDFDGAPDPKLAFGNAQSVAKGTLFAPLKANTGAQTYPIPGNVDPSAFTHVYLWCEQFDVPLGVARLSGN